MAKATKQHTPPALGKTNTPPARKQARKQDMRHASERLSERPGSVYFLSAPRTKKNYVGPPWPLLRFGIAGLQPIPRGRIRWGLEFSPQVLYRLGFVTTDWEAGRGLSYFT
jgi:hypothetical protein